MAGGMLLTRLALVLAGALLPATAAAQAWLDAYQARDYERAARLLHEIVTDPDFALTGRDPRPSRHLSVLYEGGLGVRRDPILACALAQDAEVAAQMAPPAAPIVTREDADRYEAGLQEARAFAAARCATLPAADLAAASRLRGGCYAFDLDPQVWTIDGRAVRVSHDGIAVDDRTDHGLEGFMCAASVARVRPISLTPPRAAAPGVGARHFIELIVWRTGVDRRAGGRAYVAEWHLLELTATGLAFRAQESLHEVAHWPGAAVPPVLDAGLSMEMMPSGQVRWRIDGTKGGSVDHVLRTACGQRGC